MRFAAVGAWLGGVVAVLWLGGWVLRLLPLAAPGLLLVPIALGALFGALFGATRPTPSRSERALLLDSLLALDEACITAVEMGDAGAEDPRGREVFARLERALPARGELSALVPLTAPRHARFLPLLLLVLLVGLYIPQVGPSTPKAAKPGDLQDEAERLEQRKEELEDALGAELPSELDDAFDELVGDMKAGDVTRSEAAERAQDLRDKLDELAKEQADAGDGATDAAQALESVDQEAAQDLADALRQGNLEDAAKAVEEMRERMKGASPDDKERAARELERAAKEAAKAGNEGLSEALKKEAERARQEAAQQGDGQAGEQGEGQQGEGQQRGEQGEGQQGEGQQGEGQQGEGQQGESGSGDGLAEYLRQLEQQGVKPSDMAQQQKQMEMAQELNGALGGAEGRLGGRGRGDDDEGSGQGKPGQDWGAGTSHTDAVSDPFSTDGAAHKDMNRQVDGKHSSWVVDELGDNPEERLANVQALTQSVNVPLGDGPIDSWDIRLNEGSETAATPLSAAPPAYREAAEEAVDGENVPRAYRDQIKQYFDLEK